METYTFYLIAAGEDWALDFSLADSIMGTCQDSSPGSRNGQLEITFHREAGNLEEAVLSAIADIEKVDGLRIDRVLSDHDPMIVRSINGLLDLRNTTTQAHALEMWSKVG